MSALVVTADDFGLCAPIDEAICELHDRGIVHRTSLIVNTPRFDASADALRRRPGLEVAIHLNLTDGRPVLPPDTVGSLVDEAGNFQGGRHYGVIARILTGRMRRQDIVREWRAQIVKAKSAGLTCRELNSHGHIHLLPRLHAVVLELRREFDIPQVRLVRSLEGPRGVLLHLCSLGLARRLRKDGVTVGRVRALGLRSPGAVDRRIRLADLAGDREVATELIVHPSLGINEYHSRWGYAGDDVLSWLLRDGACLRQERAATTAASAT